MTGVNHKVCIVIPPSAFLLDERVFPFLGPLKVAASLEEQHVPVEVLDLSGYSNFIDAVRAHALSSDARHFALTATTPQLPAAAEIAKTIRAARPDSRLILGGTHATLTYTAVKRERTRKIRDRAHRAMDHIEELFDVIVSGDGELAIFEAIKENAPRVIDADDRKSPMWMSDEKLTASPFPARHLIDLESYKYTIDGLPASSLIAQLGCPYKCGFCAGRNSPMLRNIRTRSSESIIEEMLLLYKTYGLRGFMFYDDELNVNKDMVNLFTLIAKAQRDLKTEWRLRGFIKSERFTDEQALAMKEAGFRWILVGFESGSPLILRAIQKIATQEDNSRCMDIAHRHGLKVKALMSIGHPGESRETIDDTRKWLVDSRPADFDATVITPYPGSPYYDEAEKRDDGTYAYVAKTGDSLYQEDLDYRLTADYYKGNPDDGYVSHVWTDYLDQRELVVARDTLERNVRDELKIPFNQSRPALQFEHSMGQSLPPRMLKQSEAKDT